MKLNPRSKVEANAKENKKRQTQLDFRAQLTTKSAKELDHLFGVAVFSSCCSFKMFSSEEWQDFFKAVGYIPPTRQTIATTLIDSVYTSVEADVESVLKQSPELQLVADESTDISGNQIENISIIAKGTLYHWKSTNLEDNDATADNAVESI